MTDYEMTVQKIVPAPRNVVFEAWLDPKALARFMKPDPSMRDARVEVDAREGGAFSIIMLTGEREIPHRGVYKTIRRHDKLVFTWISAHTIPDSTVTIDFVDRGDETTEVTVHHVGFANDEERRNHEEGWSAVLEQSLAIVS